MKISIIKYGMGNVASVQKAINKLGFNSLITNEYDEIKKSDFIILPGVGSFYSGMENLRQLDLIRILEEEVILKKKPFLGICLGMQLIASLGNEPKKINGLGWIDGEVIKLAPKNNDRVPHLGWNNVITTNNSNFYNDFNNMDYYFIHSYHFKAKTPNDIVLTVEYASSSIVAAIQKENIYGVQFHPEKSQEAGMKLLKKIINKYA